MADEYELYLDHTRARLSIFHRLAWIKISLVSEDEFIRNKFHREFLVEGIFWRDYVESTVKLVTSLR